MYALVLTLCLLCLPTIAMAAPPDGLLDGPRPRAWREVRASPDVRREVRRELRRERRHERRRSWHRYERPRWQGHRDGRAWRDVPRGRVYLEPVPRQKDTQ